MLLIWGRGQCRAPAAQWHDGQITHDTYARFARRANQTARPAVREPKIQSGRRTPALKRIADSSRTSREVRKVPEAVMEAYSITSVAKPKTDVGISMPSIFAVFKFTTNSNLLD
jgi:hypothetical protein